MQKSSELDIFAADLCGTHLIEANAGTGKTYNITALYTRLILESKLNVENILVVTYTNAAVSDLKGKIYSRLCALRDVMSAVYSGREPNSTDSFAQTYASMRKNTLKNDIQTLKYAVRDFDRCSVFTIHGFCQRMLKESAFSGKVAYDIELTGSQREIIKRPVQDFWRKNLYRADSRLYPYLLKDTPETLMAFYENFSNNLAVEIARPAVKADMDMMLEAVESTKSAFAKVQDLWTKCRAELWDMLNPERPDYPLKRTSYKTGAVINTFAMMDFCARHNDFHIRKDDKDLIRLTKSNIQSYTAKNSESPSHPFFELAEDWYNKASELNSLSAALTSELKFRLLDYMQETLTSYKQKANLHSYDDLISRMRDAVTANYGNSGMTASLNKRYHAALIDEFQDTDPYQYEIFNTAFGRQGKPFFMIGDPKQAIYSFRGADVYAYLKAASGNTEKKTLTSNYRSTPELVTAVNTLFSGEGSFLLDKIEYSPSKGEHKELPLLVKGVRQHAMNFWESDSLPPQETARITAAHIAELLSLSEKGLATLDGKKIRPSDIAVLCRKKDQLTMVKTALSAFRVPAVVSGSESVFSSDEALELCNILTAVLAPFSAVHVKTALITPIFGLKPFETYLLEETDRWDSITEEFKAYNDIIMMRGFAPMFFNMASRTKMYEKIAGTRNGERKLTNYIHLAELAQKYEADKKAAPHDILRWMKEKITSDSIRDDEAELKMDSDENAVTIITIHKSKGLEYNIVYTPFLHMRKTRDIPPYKYHKDDKYLMDIAGDSENADIARYEEMAEDLRVAYVALTRAKAVCYTAWGTATGHDISAVSRLINGRYAKYEPGQLQRFAGTVIGVLPLPCEDIQSYLPDNTAEITPPREFNSSIPDVWRINSFSGLIHQSSGVKDTDQYTKSGVDSSTLADIFTFPKGAKAGTCLHECMESISFENAGFAEVFDITREKLARYSFDPEFAEPVAVNITSILEKDISGMKLCRLKKGEYVHEMEFQMATKHFSSEELTALFEKHSRQDFALAASTLDFNALRGFMNGFADLIFCHNGRYYVLDWKSNHLGGSPDDYSYEKMHSEMLSNHYYLQLYIYTLALHMHLKNTIRGYSYETHIGGGIYIFMRGVASSGENGIYMHRPTAQIIEDMEKMVTRQ